MDNSKIGNRNTSIELLRLLCMIFIVAYHVMLKTPMWAEAKYRAVSLVFHVGVPVFIFISGYFQIRFNWKSLCRFVGMVLFYVLLLFGLNWYLGEPKGNLFYALTPVSHAVFWDLWFVPCYLMLFLVSPFYNKLINRMSNKEMWALVLVLGFINYYYGWLFQAPSFIGGDNLFNFLMIYTAGTMVHRYQQLFDKFSWGWVLIAYVLYNISAWFGYLFLPFGKNLWFRFFFNYDSPGMLVNTILLFSVFNKAHFSNNAINTVLKSNFAIYLLHANCIVVPLLTGFFYNQFCSRNTLVTLASVLLFSVVVCLACLLVDLLLRKVHQFLADNLLLRPVEGLVSICERKLK